MLVLFVDDDESMRSSIKALFEINSISFQIADGATKCLEILSAQQNVGLVITDFQMPGMDGAELFRESLLRFSHCPPFILLTGDAQLSHRDKSLPWLQVLFKGEVFGLELVNKVRNRIHKAA